MAANTNSNIWIWLLGIGAIGAGYWFFTKDNKKESQVDTNFNFDTNDFPIIDQGPYTGHQGLIIDPTPSAPQTPSAPPTYAEYEVVQETPNNNFQAQPTATELPFRDTNTVILDEQKNPSIQTSKNLGVIPQFNI